MGETCPDRQSRSDRARTARRAFRRGPALQHTSWWAYSPGILPHLPRRSTEWPETQPVRPGSCPLMQRAPGKHCQKARGEGRSGPADHGCPPALCGRPRRGRKSRRTPSTSRSLGSEAGSRPSRAPRGGRCRTAQSPPWAPLRSPEPPRLLRSLRAHGSTFECRVGGGAGFARGAAEGWGCAAAAPTGPVF